MRSPSRAPPASSRRASSMSPVMTLRSKPAENLPSRPIECHRLRRRLGVVERGVEPVERGERQCVRLAVVEGDDSDVAVERQGHEISHARTVPGPLGRPSKCPSTAGCRAGPDSRDERPELRAAERPGHAAPGRAARRVRPRDRAGDPRRRAGGPRRCSHSGRARSCCRWRTAAPTTPSTCTVPRRTRCCGTRAKTEICVTVTLVDGLVFARSPFHNSMNYRSVVIRGVARPVDDAAEHVDALRIISDHVVANWDHGRPPTATEIRKTMVVALPLDEASAKVRRGDPIDEPDDLAGPHWGGTVALRQPGARAPGRGGSPGRDRRSRRRSPARSGREPI